MTPKKYDSLMLALALSLAASSACGRLKAVKDHAFGHGPSQGDQAQAPAVPPPPSKPLLVDKDLETWSKTKLDGLMLPAANGDNIKPYESCEAYYNEMVAYAEAQQAIYVKRYLAWARYQLAVNGFRTNGYGPYDNSLPGGIGYAKGSVGGSADQPSAMGANAGTAPTVANASTPPAAAGSAGTAQASSVSPQAPGAVASEYATNNQVKGVDETDYVKSNGQFIFVASGDLLRVLDLNGRVVDVKPLHGEAAAGLHQSGDKLLLITTSSDLVQTPQQLAPAYGGGPESWWSYWDYRREVVWTYAPLTKVHEFAIGADGTLKPGRDRVYHGTFSAGREIDGTVHLVMQKQLPWQILSTGLDISWSPAYLAISDEASLQAYAQRIAQDNLNAWRLNMFESGELMADARESYQHGHCQAFTHLTSAAEGAVEGGKLRQLYDAWDGALEYGPGMSETYYTSYPVFPAFDKVTTVATIDLAGSRDDVLGMTISPVTPSLVYASSDRLVVGNTRYQWYDYWRTLYVLPAIAARPAACLGSAAVCAVFGTAPRPDGEPVELVTVEALTRATTFFDFLSFKLGDVGAIPTGFGTMSGAPLNSYAVDAGATTLRFVVTEALETTPVAVTSIGPGYQPVAVAAGYSASQANAKLVVMSLAGSEWTKAAELPLAVDGTVSAVRFVGTAAFISLMDTTRPLYAVDLTTELAPRLVGAMPAQMRPTYFEPMGDGKTILALGRTDQPIAGAFGYSGYALTVAMVDVSDLAAPAVVATAAFDVGGSSAEYDFKSFRYVPRLGMLVLPMTWPDRLELLSADRTKGFAHFGTVSLQDALTERFGMDGNARTMVFDDLLVGVFGSQDVGATLGYAARSPALAYSKALELDYQTKVIEGWSEYWYLGSANMIAPKWRSLTSTAPLGPLMQP